MRLNRSAYSNLGLWPRMALAVTVGFAALYLTFSFLSTRALQATTERLYEQRLLIAQIAADQIDSFLEQGLMALEGPVHHVDIQEQGSALVDVAHVLDNERELSMFVPGYVLLDASGRSVLSHPAALYPAGTQLSNLPHLAQALAGGQPTISEPFEAPLDERSVVALTVPLHDGESIFGYLSGLIDLHGESFSGPLVRATTLSESEHAVVVDEQGRVVVSTFYIDPLSPGEHHTFYVRAMAERAPTVQTVPFEMDLPGEPLGHLHVMAFAPLQNAPWGVSLGGDEAEILAGVRQLRSGLFILGIGALIGVWLLTLLGTRRLVQPVQRLTEAADLVAAGDLSITMATSDGGEIGQLALALDRMRRQLLAQIEELADWNETLESRVAAQTEDLRRQKALTEQLLGQLINAQEKERQRVARDLHDEIGQTLTAVELSLGHLENAVLPQNEEARRRLQQSRALTQQTVADLRQIITALRPATLDQLGLVPALDWMGDHVLRPEGVTVKIEAESIGERLPDDVETTLFRIAQEVMSNVGRHSQATSLDISLRIEQDVVVMTLSDNGRGFLLESAGLGLIKDQGMGIASMQERAMLMGGQLLIASAPGQGTTVRVTIPVNHHGKVGGEDVGPSY